MLYLKYMTPIIVFTQLEDHIHKDQNQTIFKNNEHQWTSDIEILGYE
jgi:hypothetical protein